jgi:hypothetical protein
MAGTSAAQAGIAGPSISKAFNPASIVSGGTSTITFTLTGSGFAITGGSFSDTLANMAISGAQQAAGTCVGANTNNFANAATALAFSGLSVPATGNCSVTVLVSSIMLGTNPNTTSGVTSNEAPSGSGSNTANLTVTTTPVTLQSFDVD